MDFKSLVSKINELNDPVQNVQAPSLPKSIQLDESAQMRVLAGQTTILAEAKKKAKDEKVAEEMKVGDKKNIATGTVEKTKTGIVHKSNKAYGGSEEKADDSDDEPKAKKKAKKTESIEEASDKKKAAQDKFKAMIAKKKGEKKVAEGAKPDFLDMDKDGDKKEPMKKAVADKKAGPKKGVNPFAKKTESAMMPKGKKRPVKESVEGKLTFKEMIKLVQESGGQQQIDPVDAELFAWAQRVAHAKFNEATKQEVYAGLVYERMGGVFEMYDVLSESKKKVTESFGLEEDKSMTIMVGNSGFGTKPQPTEVFNTQLTMIDGRPVLMFSDRPEAPADLKAEWKGDTWVADMD